jgi:hypothetical protein
MPGLDQILSRVVERKGFHVQGADAEALLARNGEETLLAAWKTDGPLSVEEARIFLTAMDQVHAATGILVATKGTEPAAKEALAANKGVEVWAESRLIVEVGEAFVRSAIDTPAATSPAPSGPTAFPTADAPAAPTQKGPTKFPSLVAQAASAASRSGNGIAYYMPNKKKEAPADMRATIPTQKGGALGYAWGGMTGGTPSHAGIATAMPSKPRIKTDQWGNVVREGAAAAPVSAAPAAPAEYEISTNTRRRVANPAATGAAPPVDLPGIVLRNDADAYEIITTKKEKPATVMRDASPPACSSLQLNVTKEEAIAKTGKAGSAKLALVPHVAFEFDLEMSRPGMPAPVIGKGALLVNSLTGELRTLDALAFAATEPADARKDGEKLTAVDVYDKVKGHIAKTYAKSMNVERELAGNTVMETLKLVPDPEEMGLQHRGIVHMPTWEITGSTGIVKVEAFTGNVLG